MADRLSESVKLALQLAWQEAQRVGDEKVGGWHVLVGLLEERSGTGSRVLEYFGVDLRKIRHLIASADIPYGDPAAPEHTDCGFVPPPPDKSAADGWAEYKAALGVSPFVTLEPRDIPLPDDDRPHIIIGD
jgi:hypothetical protein